MSDDKQTTVLMQHLDNTISALFNATLCMDKVAADCKLTKGEPLIDRIIKCEAATGEWGTKLKALDWDLAMLKKLYSALTDKQHGSIASIAEGIHTTTTQRYKEMKAQLDATVKEFEALKQSLRKIKT